MSTPDQTKNRWRLTNWIVGLTGLLLVIPSLINAGIDIYQAIQNIPRTEAEQNNVALFEKHFGQQPVTTIPLPIRQGNATYEVTFSIYPNGDVFVEYGQLSQWFPFPAQQLADRDTFRFISQAYADDGAIPALGGFTPQDKALSDVLIREKHYDNGLVEQQTIDIRTGKVLKVERIVQPNVDDPSQSLNRYATVEVGVSPLKQAQIPATACVTAIGSCRLLQVRSVGESCSCSNGAGLVAGMTE